jgi:glutathione S-transferase
LRAPASIRNAGFKRRRAHADRRIPYFTDGDIKLGESVAIIFYLLDKYGMWQRQAPRHHVR